MLASDCRRISTAVELAMELAQVSHKSEQAGYEKGKLQAEIMARETAAETRVSSGSAGAYLVDTDDDDDDAPLEPAPKRPRGEKFRAGRVVQAARMKGLMQWMEARTVADLDPTTYVEWRVPQGSKAGKGKGEKKW